MQSEPGVLCDAVVKRVWFPCVREEHEGHRLTKIVELEPGAPCCVEDGCVVDDVSGNLQIARSEQQIGMRRCAVETSARRVRQEIRIAPPEWIADDEKRNVFCRCAAQDLVAFELYHIAICKDEFLAVEGFLARM